MKHKNLGRVFVGGSIPSHTTKNMTYLLLIKSHCEAPDLERETEASSHEEAISKFYAELGKYGWDRDTIAQNMIAESEVVYG